jgi:hypothetical protein
MELWFATDIHLIVAQRSEIAELTLKLLRIFAECYVEVVDRGFRPES